MHTAMASMGLDLAALQKTHQIASSLSQQLGNLPVANRTPNRNSEASIPDLVLPFPHDALSPLSMLSVPDNVRDQIIRRANSMFVELQQEFTAAYKRACIASFHGGSMFERTTSSLQQVYQTLYQKQHTQLANFLVSSVVSEIAKYQPLSVSKPSFKNEYTPALEKYFSLNGYPSVAHRLVLARSCEMTPRQIEVWFQNHRNRAKKEGKITRRLESDFPLRQALAVLQQDKDVSQGRLLTPPPEASLGAAQGQKNLAPNAVALPSTWTQTKSESLTFLDDDYANRPHHAYPTRRNSPYPDPFPNHNGAFNFPPPIWRRKAAIVPIPSMAVDMDEFSHTFHLKLNFSENSRRRGITSLKRESIPPRPWFHATTTVPYRHPALIPKLDVSMRTPPSLDIPIPKPIFGSTSFPASTSTVPLLAPSEAPARKTRPLPRRMPPRSPSSSFGSRTSSFSSDTSSGSSASSSSSSSTYSSSPGLSTPPPLPDRDLPVFHDDAQHQDYLFDFSQTDLDADYPSASQTFDFSFNDSSLNKIPDLSCFSLHFSDFNNLAQIIS